MEKDIPLPSSVRFDITAFRNPGFPESREWWMSMGNGGYLAGTLLHSLSRGYHGIGVLASAPPVGRTLFWVKWDGWIDDGAEKIPLTANHWRDDSWNPEGFRFLASFSLEGRMPVWRYRWKDRCLTMRIWFDRSLRSSILSFCLDAPEALDLGLNFYFNHRDHHGIVQGEPPPISCRRESDRASLSAKGLSSIVCVPGGVLTETSTIYRQFFYPREKERGLSDWENHRLSLTAKRSLLPGREEAVVWTESSPATGMFPMGDDFPARSRERFLQQEKSLLKTARSRHPLWETAPEWVQTLILAADTFVVDRPGSTPEENSRTIIAGYPWFGDWGRDTMIALPGLLLATGRWDEARSILLFFSRRMKDGLLPNYFPEDGSEPLYNTADASLWFVRACHLYGQATRDYATLRLLYPSLLFLIESYRNGTLFGIAIDPGDGLVRIGDPVLPLTWMDARIDGKAVTLRRGKPVELSALWFAALEGMTWIAGRLRETDDPFRTEQEKTRRGFRKFQREDGRGLHDVLEGDPADKDALRPNQILALSCAKGLLTPQEETGVLQTVQDHLLTPFGLRTLSPADPRYQGKHAGPPSFRDNAYHQGTVWPWLLGHFARASFRHSGNAAAALTLFDGLRDHLGEAGLGSISETFDGDPPHLPRGCPLQAWSVGCTLEAILDILENSPPNPGTVQNDPDSNLTLGKRTDYNRRHD
ncbi:MAG: amylo-alpha-1,6-glucosidase [Nitrospirae bacterium]|nr:amylo-alpha-1,6-glucosidase [Nitrospirota bacterium]